MSITLDGTNGVTFPNGSNTVPVVKGTTAGNTSGIIFPAANTVAFVTSGAERARFDSSGNVGIGTISPAGKLEVYNATTNAARIRVTGTATTAGNYRGFELANSSGFTGGMFQDESSNDLTFWTSTERMRIDSSGNVGIGTATPTRKLDIEQASTDYQMRIGDAGGYYYDIGRNTGNGLLTFNGNQAVASGYVFSTVNGERMRIDTSGRVTKPSQPYLRAVTSSTSQSLTGGQTYVIPYNVISAQNGSNYNNSTYRFTCPVAGQYFVHAAVEGSGITTNYYNLFLRINGSGFAGTYVTGRNSAYEQLSTTGIVSASAGDYIDVALFVNQTGGNLELNPGDIRNSLHIYLLG